MYQNWVYQGYKIILTDNEFLQISEATSYQTQDIKSILEEKEILEEPAVSKYIQKFRRESEVKQYRPKRRQFKRGTLESHSFTNVNQPTLKEFFFGSKEGSMHQGMGKSLGSFYLSSTLYLFAVPTVKLFENK